MLCYQGTFEVGAAETKLVMRLGPEELEQSPEGVVFLPGVMTFSAFSGGGIGPEGWGSITEISLLLFWYHWSLPWLRPLCLIGSVPFRYVHSYWLWQPLH